MEKIKTSVRLPADIVEQMDELAQRWNTSRTAIIIRVYLEWRDAQEESPTEQMSSHGCGRLVEA